MLVPRASADDWNHKTVVTFNAPVEVPGVGAQVLPAGTYVFQLVESPSNRHIVRITNQRGNHVYTTILAVPNYRLRTTDKTVMTFKERAEGQPEAIHAWFYPGHEWGEEFVYPKSKAIEIAKVANEPVLYTTTEVAKVEDLTTATIEAVKPSGDVVAMNEVVETPPAAPEEPRSLPATASYMPLLACAGLLSLATAAAMSKYSA
ncbi:MAG TPA: hypothetical protein VE998_03400 [Terriglobales bacterium]|nr:hypothetical protein [Terriglobales bacterium]